MMKLKTFPPTIIGLGVLIFAIGCANISAGVQEEAIKKESRMDNLKKDNIWLGIVPEERNVIVNEDLGKILKLEDFMEHYPGNWIEEYDSVKVTLFKNGKWYSEKGKNNILTVAQKELIQKIDYSSRIKINVYYQTENTVTKKLYSEQINKIYRVVPAHPAKYHKGLDSLVDYLKLRSRNKIDLSKARSIKVGKDSIATEGPVSIRFTINEDGKSENVNIEISSGDKKTDILLKQLISEMPIWKPAKNSQGKAVKQEFSLIVTLSSFGWGC